MRKIFANFLYFLVIFSILIFIVGIFETIRNDFMFDIISDNFINAETMPTHTLNGYLDFKNSYIFTNNVFLVLLNLMGLLGLFYIFVDSWRRGWKAEKSRLRSIFISYGLLFILLTYFFIMLFNYLANIFINQLIIILFEDIYNSLYVFKLFIEHFIFLYMFAILCYYLSNQLANFSVNDDF